MALEVARLNLAARGEASDIEVHDFSMQQQKPNMPPSTCSPLQCAETRSQVIACYGTVEGVVQSRMKQVHVMGRLKRVHVREQKITCLRH